MVDDVLTTGATLSECARTLRLAGAEAVVCTTLARAEKYFLAFFPVEWLKSREKSAIMVS